MNTWYRALIISLTLSASVIAAEAVAPRERVTEPSKVDQFTRVQSEIFDYINRFIEALDSAQTWRDGYQPQFGIDTTSSADSTVTVYLDVAYADSGSWVVTCTPDLDDAAADLKLCHKILSDSSFIVYSDSGEIPFHWIAMGEK